MAFDRKLLTGNTGVGSFAPAIYTYGGDEVDLTPTDLQTTNVKPTDIIIISDGVLAPATKGVTDTFTLV